MIEQGNSISLREEGIPIGLWVSPPPGEITTERYREIREAGFTFVIGLSELSAGTRFIHEALDAAHKNELKYLVYDTRLRELSQDEMDKAEAYVAEFAGHPAYLGHLFVDEPSIDQFDRLRALKSVYQKAVPHGLAYVNLFPTYASDEQRGGSHEVYVQSFMEKFEPDVLSYDHYPLLTPRPGKDRKLTEDYYENLQLMREAALGAGVPLWLFIQTLAFNRSNRDPSEAEIHWQVYTSLAFGVKGIQYFTYWTPDDGNETFGDAMIDRGGNQTRHYGEVQRINREIEPIGKVLVKLVSEGVLTHGDIRPAIEGGLTQFAPIGRMEGDPVIVGCFRDQEGLPYALIVNESFSERCSLRMYLSMQSTAVHVWEDGCKVEASLEQGILALELEPGKGKLIAFS